MENENPNLEKQELEKAAENLKNIDFTQDNYKELLEILNKIKEITKSKENSQKLESQKEKEQFIPHEKEIERKTPPETTKEDTEKEESQAAEKEQDVLKQGEPIVFGTTILPSFALMTDKGLKNFENAKVISFDKATDSYLLDNGKEKLSIPKETFETILNPVHADKSLESNTILQAQKGPAIVNKDTVLPEFALITSKGIESFKDLKVVNFNEAENSYTLSNGNSTLTVTGDTFKEIIRPERFENQFEKDTPAYEKLLEFQYNDFFKQRDNTANNFRHNLSVYCRKEANSPLDALTISKEIISRMSKEEKEKTRLLLNQIKKEDETINQFLVRTYYEAIKEVPLDKEKVLNQNNEKLIAKPFYDTINGNGQPVDENSTLKIGDTVKDLAFNVPHAFGHGKTKIFEDLTVISSSKEGNNVILMDKNRSFYEVPRDKLLEGYNKQQEKQQKAEQKHRMANRIDVGWER